MALTIPTITPGSTTVAAGTALLLTGVAISGTAADFTSENPTLAAGRIGYETDTDQLKIGDGTTAWAALAYFEGSGGGDGDLSGALDGNITLGAFTIGAATDADLTKLHALTATATELNYVDGVTSAIQTQLDAKAASAHTHPTTDLTGVSVDIAAFLVAADAAAGRTVIATIADDDARLTDRRKVLTTTDADPPTVDDDEDAGFAAGDRWVTPTLIYDLYDASAGAADWRQAGLTEDQADALDDLSGFLTAADILPPYDDIPHNVATYNLAMDDHLCWITSTDGSPEFTIRAQADYAWADKVLINFDLNSDGIVIAATGVTINGVSASSWTVQSNPSGATLRRTGTNTWRLQGDVVVI